jgi:HEAT repeat protein
MKKAMRWVGAGVVLAGVVWVFWHPSDPEGPGGPEVGPAVESHVAAPGGGGAVEAGPAAAGGGAESAAAQPAEGPAAPLDPAEAAVQRMLAGKTPDDWEPVLMELVENGDERTVAALKKALAAERRIHHLMLISRVLCGIGTEEAVAAFMDFLDEPRNARYREFLAGALMGLENEERSDMVLDWLLQTTDYDITMASIEAIGRLSLAETLERIIGEHSRTNYNEYKLELMRTALAESECPEALELFAEVLRNPPGREGAALQEAAAQALARIGTPEALEALLAALERSPRAPEEDFLVEAVAGMAEMHDMAYLQARFDEATAPNVRYALGRALAEAVPIMKQYVEPPPGVELDWPEDADETAVPMAVGMDEGEWEPEPEAEEGEDEDNPFADVELDEYGYPVMSDEEPGMEEPARWGPRVD